MIGIKIGDEVVIPQIGYRIVYSSTSYVSGRLDKPIEAFPCNLVEVTTHGSFSGEKFAFPSKEGADLFISDLLEGLDLKIIDPNDSKYH